MPAVSQARSMVGTIASRWARLATSGTTPPKRACSSTLLATASASSVWPRTIPTPVSSQEVSMPRTRGSSMAPSCRPQNGGMRAVGVEELHHLPFVRHQLDPDRVEGAWLDGDAAAVVVRPADGGRDDPDAVRLRARDRAPAGCSTPWPPRSSRPPGSWSTRPSRGRARRVAADGGAPLALDALAPGRSGPRRSRSRRSRTSTRWTRCSTRPPPTPTRAPGRPASRPGWAYATTTGRWSRSARWCGSPTAPVTCARSPSSRTRGAAAWGASSAPR